MYIYIYIYIYRLLLDILVGPTYFEDASVASKITCLNYLNYFI